MAGFVPPGGGGGGGPGPPGPQGPPGEGVPAGGVAGEILTKQTVVDYETAWVMPDPGVPPGGAASDVLTKQTAADYDIIWAPPASGLPPGGATNDVLTKQSPANFDAVWRPAQLTGQFVRFDFTDAAAFTDTPIQLPANAMLFTFYLMLQTAFGASAQISVKNAPGTTPGTYFFTTTCSPAPGVKTATQVAALLSAPWTAYVDGVFPNPGAGGTASLFLLYSLP